MSLTIKLRLKTFILLVGLIMFIPIVSSAAELNDLLGKKEVDEKERKETIERIENIQEKLKLLQDKLRVLERRKAAKAAAERAEERGDKFSETPVQVNWTAIDETAYEPGEFGLYTYLLFNGSQNDFSSIGLLEDFILTIETLPAHDIPPSLANQFLVPVEKPQSMIKLGRQPYDFKLNQAYLNRLAINSTLPKGPVLVSTKEPVDPYGTGDIPDYIAVGLGKQLPEKSADLARIWHQHEKSAVVNNEHAVAEIIWLLIDGIGPVQVSRNKQSIAVVLP